MTISGRTAKELLVLFMYSDNIYNADAMRHKIKKIRCCLYGIQKRYATNWIYQKRIKIREAARADQTNYLIDVVSKYHRGVKLFFCDKVMATVTDFEQLDSIISRYFPDKFFYLKLILAAGYSSSFY